jgi:hypothetical protein
MRQLASFLDQTIRRQDSSLIFNLEEGDFLQWGRRSRFNGLVLDHDVLVLDYRMFSSFRIKIANLPTLQSHIRRYKPRIPLFDRNYKTAYFAGNHDNPYGLWNIFLAMRNDQRPDDLTQFPPLYYPKNAEKQGVQIDLMREKSQPGDLFFTFDRSSGLARLIRAWDHCMWSHCGMVGHENKLYEMTTSGAAECDFSRLCRPSLDVGLYRVRDGISEYDPDSAIDFMKKCVAVGAPYGWNQLLRKALKKKFGIPFKKGPDDVTPADYMYSNKFTLICFA